MIKKAAIFIAVLIILSAFGIKQAECAEPSEDYAAKVNGEEIPLSRYLRAVKAAKKDLFEQRLDLSTFEAEASVEAFEESMIEAAVLDQLIDSMLVEQGLNKEGIVISEEDVRKKIEEFKKGFPSSQEFHKSVAEQNMTIDDLKVNIKRQLSVDKIKEKLEKDIIILEEEIQEFYGRNFDIFVQKGKVKLRLILVPTKEEAETVLTRLASGEDFGLIAIDMSVDNVTKGQGGDIGFIERDDVDGAVAEMAFILKPGHISPVIETDSGYYIIKVEDRIPEKRTTISKARGSIERFLLEEKAASAFQKWLDEQKFDADIVINEDLKNSLP